MTDGGLAEVIRENSAVIVDGVRARMINDPSVVDIASSRSTDPALMSANVVGFWLEGIQTDLALGSTAAMEQSLNWLVRLRAGQEVPFEDAMVARLFEDISEEILTCLPDDPMRQEYGEYSVRVRSLIGSAFPGAAMPS